MTTPARVEVFCPGLKLSATPNARIPDLFRCRRKLSRGLKPAPTLLTCAASGFGVSKIYSLRPGTSLTDGLLAIAKREKIRTAKVEAIGGVKQLRIAYFNSSAKRYEEHEYDEFLEVASLIGNFTLKDEGPFLHLHGTFGRRDMSVIGGHVVSGTVFPLLEAVITTTANRALRRFDEKMGLNVIYKILQRTGE
jgi:predicted DNA-binding protein with PD1-like motif